jgi:NAD(P)-dependent dehydrogenase (short-subunit alcohol dehydrogenase family)
MPSLDGKVAIVTGAGRGIGREHALALARAGADVVVNDLGATLAGEGADATPAQQVVAEIEGLGRRAVANGGNVADFADAEALVAQAVETFGRLDILVNNAGIMVEDNDDDPEDELRIVRETMQTNVYGPLLLSRLAIPIMKSRRYGRIVNLSSGMGSLTEMGPGYIAYRMSKAGINVVTRVLAAEVEGMGILVNSADPGWVKTDMGGRGASRTVYKGAETPVWLATVPEGGPTGGVFRDRKAIPW